MIGRNSAREFFDNVLHSGRRRTDVSKNMKSVYIANCSELVKLQQHQIHQQRDKDYNYEE